MAIIFIPLSILLWRAVLVKNFKYVITNIVQKITLNSKNYPELLKQIYDPPKQLYILGDLTDQLSLINNPLAVVGTRKASTYGKKTTNYFVRTLAKAGLTIISGLALGIDSIAHQSTLEVKGRTVAVLGSGLNVIYPPTNKNLAQEIIKSNGVIISEYPPNTRPSKQNFPTRNRIIAGLSLGVLVIEAPEKSGALITARAAIEQGREVFVVPGSIYNENSAGCHFLIKAGAKPVTKPEDILETLSSLY